MLTDGPSPSLRGLGPGAYLWFCYFSQVLWAGRYSGAYMLHLGKNFSPKHKFSYEKGLDSHVFIIIQMVLLLVAGNKAILYSEIHI